MKTDLQKASGNWQLAFWCPGCQTHHGIPVRLASDNGQGHGWLWNGDREHPTVTPSIRVSGTVPLTDAEADKVLAGEGIEPVPLICHSYLTDGVISYLTDSSHVLKGQQIPLEDLP